MCRLPVLAVVTGGPFSGKTTLVRTLASRGFVTVPEAAMDVIRRLNDEMGPAGQRRWRRHNLPRFQDMVLALQLEREGALEKEGSPVILDRGIADGIAYFRHNGHTPPEHLMRAAQDRRYAHAFVLETLEQFDERRSSGRTSRREDSVRIGDMLAGVYEELRVPVTRVACMPVERRASVVIETLEPLCPH